jgi:hypothetical protein
VRWPDFLVIGAAKAGTTSLHHYLGEHPSIFVSPVKEPGFFAFADHRPQCTGPGDEWVLQTLATSPDSYCSLFDQAKEDQIAGESSPVYLVDENTPSHIHSRLPDVRLIVILRNPMDRAFSQFRFMRACGREPERNFLTALMAEDRRLDDGWMWGWGYRRAGMYHHQLSRYLEYFDSDQLEILLFDDLERDPLATMQGVFEFLGVAASFRPDVDVQHNVTRATVDTEVSRFLKKTGLRRLVHGVTTPAFRRSVGETRLFRHEVPNRDSIDPDAAEFLRSAFSADLAALERIVNRDLGPWSSPGGRVEARS